MDRIARSHRGGVVLLLGILSLAIPLAVIFLPAPREFPSFVGHASALIGLSAVGLGWWQLARRAPSGIASASRVMIRVGQVLGAFTILGWLGISALVAYIFAGTDPCTVVVDAGEGKRTVTTYGSFKRLESEHQERLGADETWRKTGPAVLWGSPPSGDEYWVAGRGDYLDGKRQGEWKFWDRSGSFDAELSGLYDDDCKVGVVYPPGVSPPRPTDLVPRQP